MHAILFCCFIILACSKQTPCVSCKDCATCSNFEKHEEDGFLSVTLDLTGCKGTEEISWICCRGSADFEDVESTCSIDSCPPERLEGETCHQVKKAVTLKVPTFSTQVTLQVHDGRFFGTVDCSAAGGCCGEDRGSCGPFSSVCEFTVDLSTCPSPDCEDDLACEGYDDDCGVGTCVDGECKSVPLPGTTVCRPAADLDLCDLPEFCDGTHTYCPEDYTRRIGWTYRCSESTFTCGLPKASIVPVETGTGFQFGLPAGAICEIGTITNLHELTWPDCEDDVWIESECETGRPVDLLAGAYCDSATGEWGCTYTVDGEEAGFPYLIYSLFSE